jgi:hypothetical protein
MMNGVSDIARVFRNDYFRPGGSHAQDALERVEVGGENLVFSHADIMTPARQRPGEQCFLDRLTADVVPSVFARQERQIMEPNQADLHRLESNGVALKAT